MSSTRYDLLVAYRVDLTARSVRDLDRLFSRLHVADSRQAAAWFTALEDAILGLETHPERCSATPENERLRHLLHGRGRNVYRVIFQIDEIAGVVRILHIRHGARQPFEATSQVGWSGDLQAVRDGGMS